MRVSARSSLRTSKPVTTVAESSSTEFQDCFITILIFHATALSSSASVNTSGTGL